MVATASMRLFMRTLQSSSLELSQLVREAMAANPVLEEAEPHEPARDSDGLDTFEPADPEMAARREFALDSLHASPTLAEFLREQVRQSAFEPALERALLMLIGELDRRGVFEEAPEAIARRLGIPPGLLAQALATLRELEPAGVGARDLRDSLLIQLEHLGESDGLSAELLRSRWDDLVRHRYDSAARALHVSADDVQAAALRIARLNPDPGSGFLRAEAPPAVPDLIVTVDERGEPAVSPAESSLPALTMNPRYKEMLAERADNRELRSYLGRCFREGRALIRAIAARQETILAVGRAIVKRQKEFFLRGAEALLPLKMDEVAADAGVHPSTVSRAVNGKYLLCGRGLFELKYFFQSGVSAEAETAGEAAPLAAGAVQAQIRKLIDAESPSRPLSDAKIEAILARQGVNVARRTIAKYRGQMKILPASLRKRG